MLSLRGGFKAGGGTLAKNFICPIFGAGQGIGSHWFTLPPSPGLTAIGNVRTAVRHPVKAVGNVLGHKLEVIFGEHTGKRHMPPKIPKHPMQDLDQNMNEILTYGDLKIRWQWTTKFSSKKMKIARRWKSYRCIFPQQKPTCSFIWHRQMPHRSPMPEIPSTKSFPKVDGKNSFAVFKSSILHQHKVTVGDLVQCNRLARREAGEQIVFGTVLMVGCKDFSIMGKPTVPYAKVKATIEQQTLTREMLSFKYKPRKKQSRFKRVRFWVTMVRIDDIIVDPNEDPDPLPPKPVRLLDLWANRWLDPVEKQDIEMVDGPEGQLVPKVTELYDGSEHQPGTYHQRGLTSCYRFWPDPGAYHRKGSG